MTHNTTQARACLEAARTAHDTLRDTYAAAHARDEAPPARYVADLHNSIRFGLKAAEVEALIAIAEALAPVRAAAIETSDARTTAAIDHARAAGVAVPGASRFGAAIRTAAARAEEARHAEAMRRGLGRTERLAGQ